MVTKIVLALVTAGFLFSGCCASSQAAGHGGDNMKFESCKTKKCGSGKCGSGKCGSGK